MSEYFAIELDINTLMVKIDEYYESLQECGWNEKIMRSFSQYYGRGIDGSESHKIKPAGKQGEISTLTENHYRSLLRYQLALVTSERPAADVVAINTDYKSQTQATIGEEVMNFYLSHKGLEDKLKEATEEALSVSEGFIGLSWDAEAGEPVWGPESDVEGEATEDGSPVMSGDINYTVYNTLDVPRDVRKKGDPDWVVVRSYESKYEMAARFPEHEDHILSLDMYGNDDRYKRYSSLAQSYTDMIPVFRFYHKKCKVLPEGRWGYFVENKMLMEGSLPYEKIPVYRIAPANLNGTCLGYTQGFDLLGLQESYDRLLHAVTSNNITFSRQCIKYPKTANINVNDIGNGLVGIAYDDEDGRIESLQLTHSAPETYNLLDRFEKGMEKHTGINDVIRGDPSANLRSGNALALVSAQAVKFNSALQNSYNKLFEDVCSATLDFLKKFGDSPIFYTVVGKTNKSYLKEFKGQDLAQVSRVEVRMTNPMSKTTAGRLEMANNMLQQGLITQPDQYISVLESGQLKAMTEGKHSEMLNIKAENERLREGNQAQALLIDNHALHIQEHKVVINDPEARDTPEIAETVLNHIMEHYNLWLELSQNPNLMLALGQQPIAPQQAPGQPAPGAGGPSPAGPMQGAPSPEESIEAPNMPDLPDGADPTDVAAYDQLKDV